MSHGPILRMTSVIMRNVRREIELYEPMCDWLQNHLEDKYSRRHCEVYALDTHAVYLDSVLNEYSILDKYPQTVGLQIQIDVLGVAIGLNFADLVFIEAKKTPLNLHDLGQLWAYCKLCDPAEAYLMSSAGLGSLSKVLVNLGREDILDFGEGRSIKKMQVAAWDVGRCTIEYQSIVPKL